MTKKIKSSFALLLKRLFAHGICLLENIQSVFWKPVCWVLLFCGIWGSNTFSILGTFPGFLLTCAFWSGLIWLVKDRIKDFSWPSSTIVDKRIETESGIKHRPLAAVKDKLFTEQTSHAENLWDSAQKIAQEQLDKIRFILPRPVLPYRDPYCLRFIALLIFITGTVIAGNKAPERIQSGLNPLANISFISGAPEIVINITPPEYTGWNRLALTNPGIYGKTLDIAQGSTIEIFYTGGWGTPHINKHPLQKQDKKSWYIKSEVAPKGILTLTQLGKKTAEVTFNYIPDTPPLLKLREDIKILDKGQIKAFLSLYDDYGIVDLTMHMTLDPVIEEKPIGSDIILKRTLMSPANPELKLNPVYDLTYHTWAGLPAQITFEITDHLGQKSTSGPHKIVLPERMFLHPVAKRLIDIRKELIWESDVSYDTAQYELESILRAPEQFENDFVTFLSLRSMATRLAIHDPLQLNIPPLVRQLWDTALRIEEGDLPAAQKQMEQARQKLSDLLNDPNSTDEEIAMALEELKMAMSEYFQEIAKELRKRAESSGQPLTIHWPEELQENAMSAEDLAALMDQIQSQALGDNRDEAHQLLSQLQQMMDGLNTAMNTEMPPEMKAMNEAMAQLQDLIQEQQDLRSQTEKLSQTKQNLPEFNNQTLEAQQNELQDKLNELMGMMNNALGQSPEGMDVAGQDMGESSSHLNQSNLENSLQAQDRALDALQNSLSQMGNQMQQMMKNMQMFSMGMGQTDPLGRPMDKGNNGIIPHSGINIPNYGERKRIHEILEKLRERAGEYHRPEFERDYYHRLIKQF